MRLRRETGDFQIVLNAEGKFETRKGLKAEQFVGEIIKTADGKFVVVTLVEELEAAISLNDGDFTYNPVTGIVAAKAEVEEG